MIKYISHVAFKSLSLFQVSETDLVNICNTLIIFLLVLKEIYSLLCILTIDKFHLAIVIRGRVGICDGELRNIIVLKSLKHINSKWICEK